MLQVISRAPFISIKNRFHLRGALGGYASNLFCTAQVFARPGFSSSAKSRQMAPAKHPV